MAAAVPLIWGMGFVFAKAAIDHFPPIFLMSLRFALTAVVFVWAVRVPKRHLAALCGIAVISAAIQYSLTFTGLKGLDASVAVLAVQLEVPFLVLLGAVLLGETVGLRKYIGIAVALAGVAVIAGEPSVQGAWLSLGLVIGGAFMWALGQALIRRLRDIDGPTVTAWISVFAAPQLLIMSLVFETGQVSALQSAGWVPWATVIYLGLVMNAVGYGFWNALIRRHPVSRVAPFLLLLPVFTVAGAVVVLGEALTWQLGLGGGIVLIGLAVVMIERPERIPARPSVS